MASDIKAHDSAEKKLEAETIRLESVLNASLDGIITIDSKGIVQSFNPACVKLFGYEANEVIGQNVKMLMPEPYHSEHDGYLHNYLSTGDKKIIGIGREVSAQRKDGSVFPMELGVNEMLIQGKTLFVGTIHDITEQKQAEAIVKAERTRLESVLNASLDGIITIDSKGMIQSFNPACVKMFGYVPEEVIGQNVKILMPEPYHSEHDGYLHNYLSSGDKKIIGIGREVSAQRKDGSVFPMELGVNEMIIDGKKMFVGNIHDITERKQAEEEILHSNVELQRFAYVASHDLQEPLRMVMSFTKLLKQRYADKLDETANEFIQFAYDAALRMQALVNDLLEYSRIGHEAENYIDIDVNELIETVKHNLNDSISVSGATITHDFLPTVRANPVRLLSVLQNLLGNAIKYQSPNTKPAVLVNAVKDEDYWKFSITDNGIGMNSEYCEKIFEPFKRLHAQSEYSGTGIGLAICRRIIEGFGGKIWAESNKGVGSTFYFTIPAIADE